MYMMNNQRLLPPQRGSLNMNLNSNLNNHYNQQPSQPQYQQQNPQNSVLDFFN
jgi:hypothetical protein